MMTEIDTKELLGERVLIILVLQVDEMQSACVAIKRLDGRNNAPPVADGCEHSNAGDCCHFAHNNLISRKRL